MMEWMEGAAHLIAVHGHFHATTARRHLCVASLLFQVMAVLDNLLHQLD